MKCPVCGEEMELARGCVDTADEFPIIAYCPRCGYTKTVIHRGTAIDEKLEVIAR